MTQSIFPRYSDGRFLFPWSLYLLVIERSAIIAAPSHRLESSSSFDLALHFFPAALCPGTQPVGVTREIAGREEDEKEEEESRGIAKA